MKVKLIKIKESLRLWIDNDAPMELKESLIKEWQQGNFDELRKLKFGIEIDQIASPVIDHVGRIFNEDKNNDYKVAIFLVSILASLSIALPYCFLKKKKS